MTDTPGGTGKEKDVPTKKDTSRDVSDHSQKGGENQRQKYEGGLPGQGQKAKQEND